MLDHHLSHIYIYIYHTKIFGGYDHQKLLGQNEIGKVIFKNYIYEQETDYNKLTLLD